MTSKYAPLKIWAPILGAGILLVVTREIIFMGIVFIIVGFYNFQQKEISQSEIFSLPERFRIKGKAAENGSIMTMLIGIGIVVYSLLTKLKLI